MQKRIFNFCLFLVLGFSSQAQNSEFIKSISGSWKGEGSLFQAPANFEMTWTEVLGGQFVQLDFKNSFEQNGTAYEMQAKALYQFKEDKITGTWFDSRGQVLPLTATLENNTLTTLWGNENTEQGKTVYQLTESGQLMVEDFFMREGVYVAFGKSSYNKNE